MPNLHTVFCHKCNKFMGCPYLSVKDGELYHKECLPEAEDAVELPQYIEVRTFRPYKYIVDYLPSEES